MSCKFCFKNPPLCLCEEIKPVDNKIQVIVLQHPQEKKEELATAPIIVKCLKNSTLKIGLSWKNLSAVVGKEAKPSEWIILYLGSKSELQKNYPIFLENNLGKLIFVKDKTPVNKKDIKGIIVLDGSWKEVKTLWWRNAWALKLKRAFLLPAKPSLYGKLRREPRKESVSTLEALALALNILGESENVTSNLEASFDTLLTRYKDSKSI